MSYEPYSDEDLVTHIRDHDQEQYKILVQRYQDALLRYANKILNNDEETAKDVVQQAFIKAFVNLQGFDTKRKFSSWIYRIVHNEAINMLRKYKKEITIEQEMWETIKDTSVDETIETLTKKEMQKELQALIERIPMTYKAPLTLYFFEEQSYEEISDILRIPINTVGTNIYRGKKLLHRLYEQQQN